MAHIALATAEDRSRSVQQPQQSSYRYCVCRELDSGGMATVYLARMEGPGGFEKMVAIKRIHPHLAHKREIIEMFLDEAQIVAELNHPNICSVIDFGCTNQTYFIVMEYVFGETLGRLVKQLRGREQRPSNWNKHVAFIVASAAEGLHAAHELRDATGRLRNVVHRDVSPTNISVAYDGSIRVMDFGIARAEGQLHQTGNALNGKLGYMAPERLARSGLLDRRADVWSLGVVLWELLTFRRLFGGRNDAQTVLAICEGTIPDPRELEPSIPAAIANTTMAALCREPIERLQTTRELSRQLRSYLATLGEPIGMPEIAAQMEGCFAAERELRQIQVNAAKTMADPSSLGSLSDVEGLRGPETETHSANGLAGVANVVPSLPTRTTAMAESRWSGRVVFYVAMLIVATSVAGLLLAGAFTDSESTLPAVASGLAPNGPSQPIQKAPPSEPFVAPQSTPVAKAPVEVDRAAETAAEARTVAKAETARESRARAREARRRARKNAAREPERKAREEASANVGKSARATKNEKSSVPAKPAGTAPSGETPSVASTVPTTSATPNVPPAGAKRSAETRRPTKREVPATSAYVVAIAVDANGPLGKREVSRAIKRQRSHFSSCYARARRLRGSDRFGSVAVRFRIGSARRAESISIGTAPLPGLAKCVGNAMKGVRTINASDTGETRVAVQVTFARK